MEKMKMEKMYKKISKILRGISLFINVILFISGIVFVVTGTYAYFLVDLVGMIGKEYKKNVPSKETFLAVDQSGTIKDVNDFFSEQIDNLEGVFRSVVVTIIIIGAFLFVFCAFGVVVTVCGSKKWILLVVYLSMLVAVFCGCVSVTVYFSDTKTIQHQLFNTMENFAYVPKAPNRFFMAVIQYRFNCCAIRSPIDYYCQGTYDYRCNPGCSTTNTIWDFMIKTAVTLPMCYSVPVYEKICELRSTPKECEKNLNIRKPINAENDTFCENYKNSFQMDGRPLAKWDFDMYDSGRNNNPKDKFQVRGSPYYETDPITNSLFGNRNPIGCGYVAWRTIPIELIIYCFFIHMIVICTACGLLIAMAAWCLVVLHKKNRGSISFSDSDSDSDSNSNSNYNKKLPEENCNKTDDDDEEELLRKQKKKERQKTYLNNMPHMEKDQI